MTALFRCRHEQLEAIIVWMMNGMSSKKDVNVMDGYVIDTNGTRVETLAIPAIPKYNGTKVVCHAWIIDGSRERTPTATLLITG